MANKKIKVNIGDIFAIKVDKNIYSYGQVVAQGADCDSFIIYDITSEKHPNVKEIISRQIIFFINTVDVEIENGKWEIVGNAEISNNLIFPTYITKTLGGYKLLSHEGKVLGRANKSQIKDLEYLTSYSPIVLEDAVKARYGDEEWYSELDNLIYKI